VALTVAVVCAATVVVTAGEALLPRLMLDTVNLSALWFYAAGFVALISVLALVVLWVRHRSVLDLWLMLVMCAYVIEVCLISFPVPARFSVGWYTGRVYGLVSGSLVLFVLLYEITTLYAQLLRTVLAHRRERVARLMTGNAVAATIAHEIKQPLTGMTASAHAGYRWLDRSTPDLNEAKAAFKQIAADGQRAGAVIGSIQAIFKKGYSQQSSAGRQRAHCRNPCLDTRGSAGAPDTSASRAGYAAATDNRRSNPATAGVTELNQKRHRIDGGQGWAATPMREVGGPS
jgi:signal transduction histidine kinase